MKRLVLLLLALCMALPAMACAEEAQTQRVKDEIVKQATALTISFATKLDVIGDLMTLLK